MSLAFPEAVLSKLVKSANDLSALYRHSENVMVRVRPGRSERDLFMTRATLASAGWGVVANCGACGPSATAGAPVVPLSLHPCSPLADAHRHHVLCAKPDWVRAELQRSLPGPSVRGCVAKHALMRARTHGPLGAGFMQTLPALRSRHQPMSLAATSRCPVPTSLAATLPCRSCGRHRVRGCGSS